MAKRRIMTPHQRASWTLFFAMVLMLGLSFLSGYILKPSGSGKYINIMVLESVPIFIVILLYITRRKVAPKPFFRLNGISLNMALFMVFFGVCVRAMGMILNIPIILLTSKIGQIPINSAMMPSTTTDYLWGLASIALVPAVFEELLCRGILLREYESYGLKTSVFASALCFAVVHNIYYTLPFTLFFGIMMAIVTIRTESIYPAMIMHFSNNALSLTINFAMQRMPQLSTDPTYILALFYAFFLLALCFVFMLIRFNKKTSRHAHQAVHIPHPQGTHTADSTSENNPKPRFGFSWAMLFLIIIFIIMQVYIISNMLKKNPFL